MATPDYSPFREIVSSSGPFRAYFFLGVLSTLSFASNGNTHARPLSSVATSSLKRYREGVATPE